MRLLLSWHQDAKSPTSVGILLVGGGQIKEDVGAVCGHTDSFSPTPRSLSLHVSTSSVNCSSQFWLRNYFCSYTCNPQGGTIVSSPNGMLSSVWCLCRPLQAAAELPLHGAERAQRRRVRVLIWRVSSRPPLNEPIRSQLLQSGT